MAHHLPPIQPLWSFASPVSRMLFSEERSHLVSQAPTLGWSVGVDGRPRPRWAVGRTKADPN